MRCSHDNKLLINSQEEEDPMQAKTRSKARGKGAPKPKGKARRVAGKKAEQPESDDGDDEEEDGRLIEQLVFRESALLQSRAFL